MRILITAMGMLIGSSVFAQKVTLNDVQQKAQKATVDFLRSKRYSPSIDTRDQSVCYKKGDILYWITFEGNSEPLLYTIHRKSIRFADEKDKNIKQKREIAEMAAGKVCAERTVKSYMDDTKVNFEFPMYVASLDDFYKIFNRGMEAFDDIKKTFDEKYQESKKEVSERHAYWQNLDTTIVVVPQNNLPGTVQEKSLTISDISVRVVSVDGAVLSDYDKGIRRGSCRFLQERITLSANKAGVYKVGVRLYTPDKKLLVPEKGAQFTTITTIEVPRANKSGVFELLKFGADNDKLWKAGEYKIEFFEDNIKIYENAINIL